MAPNSSGMSFVIGSFLSHAPTCSAGTGTTVGGEMTSGRAPSCSICLGDAGASSDEVVAFVQKFVRDLKALIGQADFVCVGMCLSPGHLARSMPGSAGFVLTPDVTSRSLRLAQE